MRQLCRRSELVETPLGVTSNVYDGATSRLLSSVYTAGPVRRETFYLYNGLGEQVGTVQDGVTNRADVAYELLSNHWWRVTREAIVGPSTNALAVTRERLTGLSDDVRSQIVVETSSGDREETLVSYDPATGIETKNADSSRTGVSTLESRYGLEVASADASGTTTNRYDAFGRRTRVEKGAVVREYVYDVAGSLVETRTPTATNVLVEAYRYDMLGRRVETVDALGQSIYKTYDPLGKITAEWGATYPVRYEYDTAGRRTALGMTLDGIIWNWTRWTFDPVTGLCLRKTYADGSFDSYSYTADGLLETTTYADGAWLTNEYDSSRRIVRTISSDGAQDALYGRDPYGRVVSESNAVARTAYTLNEDGVATMETWNDGTNATTVMRSVDGQGRLRSLAVGESGYSQFFDYTPDNLISSVSNNEATVVYTYADDRGETGYTLEFASGLTFTRSVTRDPHRPGLVTSITNRCGSTVRGLSYTHDDLSRPVTRNADTFGYNARGEVSFARIDGNAESHAYDLSGNSTLAAFNFETNLFTANALNQYDSVSTLRASASPQETNPRYDADGNLLSFGPWTYTYDSASRLVSVSSNDVLLVMNFYDAKGRRVRKVTPTATHTFLYDGWNLIRESVAYVTGGSDTFEYFWGRDLSGSLQGAGGVGGLLYLKRNGSVYIPFTDANGNITAYADSMGAVVAEYVYDAFGRTISQSGTLADVFRHRFSSKYFDVETGLYYYGYRFYSSKLCRWVTRDIRGEDASLNLYLPCDNKLPFLVDPLGDTVYVITDSTPSRKQSITVRRGGSVIAPRGVTKLTGSLKFVCASGCKIKTKGVIQLWIELLNEDDPKWQEHYSRYSGNNVTSESQNTLNHELDHFNTWKAFLDFVRTANAYDGKKVSNCAELVGRLNATYERYKSITSAHSLKFDQPGWNQGGQYSRHPLETSTFKWE